MSADAYATVRVCYTRDNEGPSPSIYAQWGYQARTCATQQNMHGNASAFAIIGWVYSCKMDASSKAERKIQLAGKFRQQAFHKPYLGPQTHKQLLQIPSVE